jgi:uncharacterized damage-inducible protein DinB
MSTLAPLIEAWDEAHREFAIALGNFPDEDLWKRPHPRLLSVGELAGHVAHWQAVWTSGAGDRPKLEELAIKSPLLHEGFRYYTTSVDAPFELSLSPAEVMEEVKRVHEAVKQKLAAVGKDDPHEQWGTWGNLIQYQVFHVAYHTGQVYSVRHLLGHETEDN